MTQTEAKTTGEMINESLSKLKRGGEVTEIRIMQKSKGTVSGYFDDNKKLAEIGVQYDRKVQQSISR
jgi:predicted RNA-binding protein Jag